MTGRPRGRRPRRPVPPSKGAGRPCIRRTGSSRPTDGCDDCPGISAAQHRRRPGGPSRYSAATFRACRVTPTRATRGAAAPVTKHKKEPGVDARPVLVLSVQLSAAMNPRTGGSRVGEAPRPFFPPISLGRNGGAVVGPSCGSFASGQARKLIPSAGPPLPTTTTPLGRRGGPIGRVPGGTPADSGPARCPAPTADQETGGRGRRAGAPREGGTPADSGPARCPAPTANQETGGRGRRAGPPREGGPSMGGRPQVAPTDGASGMPRPTGWRCARPGR